ncbi:MAG: DNA/RNA nuclease SfsA, partial [Halobacteriovoraceae bacterium]|nr:DNA/RNA nuclease SfsA [Halobacteriovoraceae bacterium]
MLFTQPLLPGKIIKRYKRFFCDIKLEKKTITAHVANTGSMATCLEAGWNALVNYHPDPKRKLKYSLQMIHNGQSWIGVNTLLTNKLAIEAIENGVITQLQNYDSIKREVKIEDSRIDLQLARKKELCFVEIKNVTLK